MIPGWRQMCLLIFIRLSQRRGDAEPESPVAAHNSLITDGMMPKELINYY